MAVIQGMSPSGNTIFMNQHRYSDRHKTILHLLTLMSSKHKVWKQINVIGLPIALCPNFMMPYQQSIIKGQFSNEIQTTSELMIEDSGESAFEDELSDGRVPSLVRAIQS